MNCSRGDDVCLGSACFWFWFVVEGRPARVSHPVHSLSVKTNHLRDNLKFTVSCLSNVKPAFSFLPFVGGCHGQFLACVFCSSVLVCWYVWYGAKLGSLTVCCVGSALWIMCKTAIMLIRFSWLLLGGFLNSMRYDQENGKVVPVHESM